MGPLETSGQKLAALIAEGRKRRSEDQGAKCEMILNCVHSSSTSQRWVWAGLATGF